MKHRRIIAKRICHFVSQMILHAGTLLQCAGKILMKFGSNIASISGESHGEDCDCDSVSVHCLPELQARP
jgi:hypothetical protein